MNSRLLPLALVTALALAACAVEPSTEGTHADAVVGAQTQTFPHLTAPQKDEVVAAFRARNGADWQLAAGIFGEGIDEITGALVGLEDKSPLGAPAAVTATIAKELAHSFLEQNADLLRLSATDIEGLRFTPFPGGATVIASGPSSRQPGYESFPSVERGLAFSFGIGADGKLRTFTRQGRDMPMLALSTVPTLPENDVAVRGIVLGRELPDGLGRPSPIEAFEIDSVDETIFIERRETETVFHLAWEFKVLKSMHRYKFVIGSTGTVLVDALAY